MSRLTSWLQPHLKSSPPKLASTPHPLYTGHSTHITRRVFLSLEILFCQATCLSNALRSWFTHAILSRIAYVVHLFCSIVLRCSLSYSSSNARHPSPISMNIEPSTTLDMQVSCKLGKYCKNWHTHINTHIRCNKPNLNSLSNSLKTIVCTIAERDEYSNKYKYIPFTFVPSGYEDFESQHFHIE